MQGLRSAESRLQCCTRVFHKKRDSSLDDEASWSFLFTVRDGSVPQFGIHEPRKRQSNMGLSLPDHMAWGVWVPPGDASLRRTEHDCITEIQTRNLLVVVVRGLGAAAKSGQHRPSPATSPSSELSGAAVSGAPAQISRCVWTELCAAPALLSRQPGRKQGFHLPLMGMGLS